MAIAATSARSGATPAANITRTGKSTGATTRAPSANAAMPVRAAAGAIARSASACASSPLFTTGGTGSRIPVAIACRARSDISAAVRYDNDVVLVVSRNGPIWQVYNGLCF